MTNRRAPRRSPFPPIDSETTIYELAAGPHLRELGHAELVVYLRLVAAAGTHPTRRMVVANAALHHDPRSATRALALLSRRGLVRVRYARTRTVELAK